LSRIDDDIVFDAGRTANASDEAKKDMTREEEDFMLL
jgi:hypothetical protein